MNKDMFKASSTEYTDKILTNTSTEHVSIETSNKPIKLNYSNLIKSLSILPNASIYYGHGIFDWLNKTNSNENVGDLKHFDFILLNDTFSFSEFEASFRENNPDHHLRVDHHHNYGEPVFYGLSILDKYGNKICTFTMTFNPDCKNTLSVVENNHILKSSITTSIEYRTCHFSDVIFLESDLAGICLNNIEYCLHDSPFVEVFNLWEFVLARNTSKHNKLIFDFHQLDKLIDKKYQKIHQIRIKYMLEAGFELDESVLKYYEFLNVKFSKDQESYKNIKDAMYAYNNLSYIDSTKSTSIEEYIEQKQKHKEDAMVIDLKEIKNEINQLTEYINLLREKSASEINDLDVSVQSNLSELDKKFSEKFEKLNKLANSFATDLASSFSGLERSTTESIVETQKFLLSNKEVIDELQNLCKAMSEVLNTNVTALKATKTQVHDLDERITFVMSLHENAIKDLTNLINNNTSALEKKIYDVSDSVHVTNKHLNETKHSLEKEVLNNKTDLEYLKNLVEDLSNKIRVLQDENVEIRQELDSNSEEIGALPSQIITGIKDYVDDLEKIPEPSKFQSMIVKDFTNASYRFAATSLTKLMHNSLVSLMKLNNFNNNIIDKVVDLFSTEYGRALLSALTGYFIEISGLTKRYPKLQRVGEECRVSAGSIVINESISRTISYFKKPKLRIAEDVKLRLSLEEKHVEEFSEDAFDILKPSLNVN